MTRENSEKLFKHFIETGQNEKADEMAKAYGFVYEKPKEEKIEETPKIKKRGRKPKA